MTLYRLCWVQLRDVVIAAHGQEGISLRVGSKEKPAGAEGIVLGNS